MKKIKQLTLSFPHGVSVKDCEYIAQKVESIVKAGVSEGGFATTNHYGINVEDVTFSDDCMHYVYGHKRSEERCAVCGSTSFAIVRDMTSRRTCKCGHSWECPI